MTCTDPFKNLSMRSDIIRITEEAKRIKEIRQKEMEAMRAKEELFSDFLAVAVLASIMALIFGIYAYIFGEWSWKWLVP